MPDTVKRKQVELIVYGKATEAEYTGRLLGLLSPEEYAGLIEVPELRNKIMTVETTPVASIGKMHDVEDFRIALAVKKRGDDIVSKKTLFITEPLDQVSQYDNKKEISLIGAHDSYIIITEVDV